jgi:transcriptional regulator with XRE-family HTH domain
VTRKRDVTVSREGSVGRRVAEARERLGLSQPDLAEIVLRRGKSGKVRHQTVYEVEKGLRAIPISDLPKWCTALGVTPGWLVGWIGEAGPGPQVQTEAAAYREIAAIVARVSGCSTTVGEEVRQNVDPPGGGNEDVA